MGAQAVPLTGANGTLFDVDTVKSVGARYMGITVHETDEATAVVNITDELGTILDVISLAAGESVSTWYGPMGKFCHGDLLEVAVAGEYEGSVFVV